MYVVLFENKLPFKVFVMYKYSLIKQWSYRKIVFAYNNIGKNQIKALYTCV